MISHPGSFDFQIALQNCNLTRDHKLFWHLTFGSTSSLIKVEMLVTWKLAGSPGSKYGKSAGIVDHKVNRNTGSRALRIQRNM